MTHKPKSKYRFWVLLAFLLASYAGARLGLYLAMSLSPHKNEQHLQIVQSILPIAKISTYKVHKVEHLEWSNEARSTDPLYQHINQIANWLYCKKLYLAVPVIATYGYELDSTQIKWELQGDTLSFYLPEPKLLRFEILWNEKKAHSERGVLSFENDHQFDELEKLFYQQKIQQYEKDLDALRNAKQLFYRQIGNFYRNLGVAVRIYEKPSDASRGAGGGMASRE